jgi:hypothetical protein
VPEASTDDLFPELADAGAAGAVVLESRWMAVEALFEFDDEPAGLRKVWVAPFVRLVLLNLD